MPPIGHSKIGASSAHRWLMCPGSVALSEGIPSKSSSFAKEGTAAHQLAEECLTSGKSPFEYINGGTVSLEDSDGNQEEYPVSANMAEAVMLYIQAVKKLTAEKPSGTAAIEQPFHLTWVDDQAFGTNDFSYGVPFDVLSVWDYKHGAGLAVDVEYQQEKVYACGGKSNKNPQLMFYAAGALGESNDNCYAEIDLGVIQPRARHPDGPIRRVTVPVFELVKWVEEVLRPGIALTKEKNAPVVPGDHCRWCPALSVCPKALEQAASTTKLTAKEVFSDKPMVFPDPADLSDAQIAKIYEFAGMLESWIKRVKEDTDARVLAGGEVNGLKVVLGNRRKSWDDPKGIETELRKTLGNDAYTYKVLSPAQAIKKYSSLGLDIDALKELIVETRGKSVVPDSDKRPAICIENAADVFS